MKENIEHEPHCVKKEQNPIDVYVYMHKKARKTPDFVRSNIQSLYALRCKKGLTRSALAELSGITEQSIRYYETAVWVPREKNYNKLAAVFGWSPFTKQDKRHYREDNIEI